MNFTLKTLTLITIGFYGVLGVGTLQQHLEDRDRAMCEKISSAPNYWKHRCSDGDQYYTIKSEEEKQAIETGQLKVRYTWRNNE